jgi:hypothetical protein
MSKSKLLYLLLIPLAGIIIYTNHTVDSVTRVSSTEKTIPAQPAVAPAAPQAVITTPENAAADPAQYGIELESNNRTEEDWDNIMEKTMTDPEATAPLEQQGMLEDLRNNPQAIKEKMERVEEEIALQKQKVRQRPGSEEEESRLQSLYMLKAMLTTLQKQATTQEDPASSSAIPPESSQ